jgi:hypothetical protein
MKNVHEILIVTDYRPVPLAALCKAVATSKPEPTQHNSLDRLQTKN